MIGLILKTESNIKDMETDWIPTAIDQSILNDVFLDIFGYVPNVEKFCYDEGDCLVYFSLDKLVFPRSIGFNCVATSQNMKVISLISQGLGAKVYDSEAGEFLVDI